MMLYTKQGCETESTMQVRKWRGPMVGMAAGVLVLALSGCSEGKNILTPMIGTATAPVASPESTAPASNGAQPIHEVKQGNGYQTTVDVTADRRIGSFTILVHGNDGTIESRGSLECRDDFLFLPDFTSSFDGKLADSVTNFTVPKSDEFCDIDRISASGSQLADAVAVVPLVVAQR